MNRKNYLKILSVLLSAVVVYIIFFNSSDIKWLSFINQDISSAEIVEQHSENDKGRCPFSGLPVNKDNMIEPPLAVIIDNNSAVDSQHGLNYADIVYEVLVEGGITRYIGLYHCNIPAGYVGPVRSLRPYFIKLFLEYGAIPVHAGGSPDSLLMLSNLGLPSIDYLVKEEGFFRALEKKKPHNLYVDLQKVSGFAEQYYSSPYSQEFSQERNPFYDHENEGEMRQKTGKEASQINITYWGGYEVSYEYDVQSRTYLRSHFNREHYDGFGGRVKPKNVIVQFVKTSSIDEEGRLSLNIVGDGRSIVFVNGMAYPGYWEKESLYEPTKYYTEDGIFITLSSGQTWVQMVPTQTEVRY